MAITPRFALMIGLIWFGINVLGFMVGVFGIVSIVLSYYWSSLPYLIVGLTSIMFGALILQSCLFCR